MAHSRGRPPHPDILTPAEWRVLEQVRAGLTNPEIASELDLSVNTVRYHVSNILGKLELGDRTALREWDGAPPRRWGWIAIGGWSAGRVVAHLGMGLLAIGLSIGLVAALAGGGSERRPSATGGDAPTPTEVAERTDAPLAATAEAMDVEALATDPSVLSAFVRVCDQVDDQAPLSAAEAMPRVDRFSEPTGMLFGLPYRISEEGCIQRPPTEQMAAQVERIRGIAMERQDDLSILCFVLPQQSTPAMTERVVEVEPYHPNSDPEHDVLYRIVKAPTDGVVFANCVVGGVSVLDVNRFATENTERWLPES